MNFGQFFEKNAPKSFGQNFQKKMRQRQKYRSNVKISPNLVTLIRNKLTCQKKN
jgi:hypothetical protein